MSGDNTTHVGYDDCTSVTAFCRVSDTVLGYYPNLGSGIFFAICFGLLAITSLVLGIWKKTYTYCIGLSIGLILESAGYIGRALMNNNPWDQGAFDLQITAIILAPTFICVSIYLTLKHVALNLNPSISRLRPRWYPVIFLPADLTCLIVQAVGGGIAAAAGKTNRKLQQGGNHAIIAGVALQVAVLLVFGVLSLDYFVKVKKWMASSEAQGTQALRTWNDANFRKFGYAVSGAYLAIFVRCIYRIAEMAGGWGNKIMQDEPSFLVLDSSLVLIGSFLLTIFHPGFLFPQMRNGQGKRNNQESPVREEAGSSSDGTKTEKA
ncbi:Efflux pump himE [Cladobotryum mycophilum]|uniref:Efflux pump himE n=1 Tax=Cladobotryum mycophilum TaxID=491253 RepID=A0ABR0S7H2_9HYPO